MKAEALGAEGADRSTITLHILTQIWNPLQGMD